MKAEYLKLDELITMAEGKIEMKGRRLILHFLDAFALLRRDYLENAGLDYSKKIFTRFGFFSGQAYAAAMKKLFKWDSLEELIKSVPRMNTIMGVARSYIKKT